MQRQCSEMNSSDTGSLSELIIFAQSHPSAVQIFPLDQCSLTCWTCPTIHAIINQSSGTWSHHQPYLLISTPFHPLQRQLPPKPPHPQILSSTITPDATPYNSSLTSIQVLQQPFQVRQIDTCTSSNLVDYIWCAWGSLFYIGKTSVHWTTISLSTCVWFAKAWWISGLLEIITSIYHASLPVLGLFHCQWGLLQTGGTAAHIPLG